MPERRTGCGTFLGWAEGFVELRMSGRICLTICIASVTFAVIPNLSAQDVATPVTPRFDYRFDAQYNATLKPYVRWYFRQPPEVQREYYERFRQMYGYRLYGIPTFACCGIEYRYVMVDLTPPVRGLNEPNSGVMRQSIERPAITPQPINRKPYDPFSARRSGSAAQAHRNRATAGELAERRVWVSRNSETGATSILYVEPSARSQAEFYSATASVDRSGSIHAIRWDNVPAWASEVSVAGN